MATTSDILEDQSLYHKLRFTGCTIFWKQDGDWRISFYKTGDLLQAWWDRLRRTHKGRANQIVHIDFPSWEQLALGIPSDECVILDSEQVIVWPLQISGTTTEGLTPAQAQHLLNLTK